VGARFGDNYDSSYGGFLNVSDSLLLFNLRDVWDRAWDDWTAHLDQIDVRGSYLSIPNPNFPDNRLWDPQSDPNVTHALTPFLPAPAGVVGAGLATYDDTLDWSELPDEIPVRLSTFTTRAVSVDYAIETKDRYVAGGTLHFVSGETVKHIPLDAPVVENVHPVRVTLSEPVHAELTGYSQITYQDFREFVEPLIVEGDPWRYFKGTQEPQADWNTLAFDDGAWLAGPTGIGYEAGSGYEACLATNLDDMRNNYLSVHLFSAAISRRTYAGQQLESLADKLTAGSFAPLITHLAEKRRISRDEIERIRAILVKSGVALRGRQLRL